MNPFTTTKTSQIRQHIADSLACFGADPLARMTESLLMREGHYCGQRFKRGEFQAVWFVEEDEIKFSDPNGNVLEVVVASELQALSMSEDRAAA
jgi:hypothetical protein